MPLFALLTVACGDDREPPDGRTDRRGRSGGVQRGHLVFGQRGGVLEAGKNILTRDRWIRGQKGVNAVPVREHPNDVMNRDARAADAGLAVADPWVNRNASVHAPKRSETVSRSKRVKTA